MAVLVNRDLRYQAIVTTKSHPSLLKSRMELDVRLRQQCARAGTVALPPYLNNSALEWRQPGRGGFSEFLIGILFT